MSAEIGIYREIIERLLPYAESELESLRENHRKDPRGGYNDGLKECRKVIDAAYKILREGV